MSRYLRAMVATAFLAVSTGVSPVAQAQPAPEFGDDASRWANDGECDDPRFAGPGMSDGASLADDIGHDATDCRGAWRSGKLELAVTSGDPDFGDDDGEWANDGECDDPRFSGKGMTATTLLPEDVLHDATDCRAAFEDGVISLH
jgi:hypothetical protein